MAKKTKGPVQDTSSVKSNGFTKSLVEDVSNYLVDDNSWTQARNAVNNSKTGDIGLLGNEPANTLCIEIFHRGDTTKPLSIIGSVHTIGNVFVLFSTDDSNHEIGLFYEDTCEYFTVVNDPCLNFSREHLIIGASRYNFDCKWRIYWSDGNNPDRYLSVDIDDPSANAYTSPTTAIPWVQDCKDFNGCFNCVNTDVLDCDKLRLAPLLQQPCFRVEKGVTGGQIPNGSYYVVGAYTINQIKVTDYFIPSNVQPLFVHQNTASSLDIYPSNMDVDMFDEFELVLVQFFNGQTVASRVGIYSTRQEKITIDGINKEWVQINLGQITLRSSIVDKSDGMFEAGPYLLRVGPTDKFDFNYQPLANQIVTKWVNVEYDQDYYREGGNNAGYLRDEVYSFFIRWVYNTGDKSASYHIPGRPAYNSDLAPIQPAQIPDAEPEINAGIPLVDIKQWMITNTAIVLPPSGYTMPDGGVVIGEGYMGYWESTEIYDDNNSIVWNASSHPWSTVTIPPYSGTLPYAYDLCGKPIRHHKFPDNATDVGPNKVTNHFNPGGNKIRIMGVAFENVKPPVDNDGNPLTNVVGYEILRGSRVGNETVVAKGMINNMRKFDINNPDDEDNGTNTNLVTTRQGLYPNYPYNDLRKDPYISLKPTTWESTHYQDYSPNPNYSQNVFTFHSPDTQFNDPYLSLYEVKMYGEINGQTEGYFDYPDKHPKHKFVTDAAFIASMLIGAGIGTLAMQSNRTTTDLQPYAINLGGTFAGGAGTGFIPAGSGIGAQGYFTGNSSAYDAYDAALNNLNSLAASGIPGISDTAQASLDSLLATINTTNAGVYTIPGTIGRENWQNVTTTQVPATAIPPIMRNLDAAVMFYNYFTEGVDTTLKLIESFSNFNQFALQYNSHCKYTNFVSPITGNKRRSVNDARYLQNQLQDLGANYRINNLFRSRAVVLETESIINNPTVQDNSRVLLGADNKASQLGTTGDPDGHKYAAGIDNAYKNPLTPFNTNKFGDALIASSHYVGVKQRLRNQYGQIEGIIQVPVSTCSVDKTTNKTGVLFNGDTYVGRYSEKNTMFFFANWLYNQPDGAEFNYRLNKMLPQSAFWMDTEAFDWSDFITSIPAAFGNISNFFSSIVTPSDKHCFDRPDNPLSTGYFTLRRAFMYLFNSGVRDFFVESSINVDLRDWGEPTYERFYDPYAYTDLKALFSTDIIKSGNYFKYDFSLSVNKLFNNLVRWGQTHTRDYNPYLAESCYIYSPNRVLYSLPGDVENKKDNWRIFLPLNYKDFRSRVVSIRPINLNGAVMFFEDDSPVQFLGVEELSLESGTKVTIGDGQLFQQPLQYLDNSDRPYEYGSCQNRLSITSTSVGIFYMSQNQGKIFAVGGKGIQEISLPGQLKWWFAQYLPYVLTNDFPDFELTDNPVIGISCQSIYDNENMMMYFCKKDYKLRKDIPYTLTYLGSNKFKVNELGITILLGDPDFFNDASWTVSYDPKIGQWISYHDWHPNLLLPGKNNFMTVDPVNGNSIWKHNEACNLYCNYYGKDYPFEVEFQADTVQQVTTMRSIQYQLECYQYAANCYDRFHLLDYNFDEAIIYNSEQNSGLLRLNLMPKNNAPLIVQYPQITPGYIDILYSKEENKYRFNQFWDVTKNRGEFVPTSAVMFNTEANGYVKNLNPLYLDYFKSPTERKKFRHYRNVVLLRRRVSGNVKMLFDIANVKNLNSPR